MNFYDFTRMLWRQKVLLIVGFAALIAAIVAMMLTMKDGQLQFRITPKYQATVRMAVVPTDLKSLATTNLGPGDFSNSAGLYGELLRSREAQVQVEEQQGVTLTDDFIVEASDRSPYITVTVQTKTAVGATKAALGAFYWLQNRLAEPVELATIPTTTTTTPSLVDSRGRFLGRLRVEVDSTYGGLASEVFLVLETALNRPYPIPLQADAGSSEARIMFLEPGRTIGLSLEDSAGNVLGTSNLLIPPIEAETGTTPELVVTVDKSAIVFGEDAADIVEGRIVVSWEPGDFVQSQQTERFLPVSVALLNDAPVPEPTGERRAPILAIAALIGGALLILTTAATVDAWQQGRDQMSGSRPSEAGIAMAEAGDELADRDES